MDDYLDRLLYHYIAQQITQGCHGSSGFAARPCMMNMSVCYTPFQTAAIAKILGHYADKSSKNL